jgi:hypothetical protein
MVGIEEKTQAHKQKLFVIRFKTRGAYWKSLIKEGPIMLFLFWEGPDY